jgi:very-short-patch-repair endonuclease
LEQKLVVELDGGQHADRVQADAIRTKQLERNGYRVLRFWNNEVLGNLDGVLETILARLHRPPHPGPLPGKGEREA